MHRRLDWVPTGVRESRGAYQSHGCSASPSICRPGDAPVGMLSTNQSYTTYQYHKDSPLPSSVACAHPYILKRYHLELQISRVSNIAVRIVGGMVTGFHPWYSMSLISVDKAKLAIQIGLFCIFSCWAYQDINFCGFRVRATRRFLGYK